jgi:cytochrome c553
MEPRRSVTQSGARGQSENEFSGLKDYKSGKRANAAMKMMATQMKDQDVPMSPPTLLR